MASFSRVKKPFSSLQGYFLGHPMRLLTATGVTVLWAHVLQNYTYTWSPTQGASMLPTLEVANDSVLISRYYRRGRDIVVGDIVTFDSVVQPGEKVIKRVIGLPGDYVLRNSPGARLPDMDEGDEVMLQVPPGHCWVVGDNLTDSRDSRHFGPMPMALIRGKIIAKVTPWRERRWIENPLVPVGPSGG